MIPSQAKPRNQHYIMIITIIEMLDQDLNLVFPWQILHGLVEEGILGSLSDQFISFMGHIDGPLIDTLVRETAISASKEFSRCRILPSLFLLRPRNQTVGLVQREIESRGFHCQSLYQ